MPANILLYGVALRDAVARGNVDEMRAFASVSSSLLSSAPEVESADLAEWEAAHKELLAAIAERESIDLDSDDIIAIKDGIVVIDSISLARALKPIVEFDLEPRVTITFSW